MTTVTTATSIKPEQCPLCHNSNLCTLSSNPQVESCWCQNVKFTPSLINQANKQGKLEQCICQNCAEKALLLASEVSSFGKE